jgi:hypothetical protein
MPAIPYIQPIPEWIKDELDLRASDPARLIKTSPFVILTSPAVATTTEHSSDMIVSENYAGKYYGCVLSNTVDVSKLYQTGNSIIGYDLNGTAIEVIGETDRKLSVPLIIDLQIEDGGENAALKTAKLNIKVFSLKQLEMFEMFFLRPGMQLLLEYGHNSDLTLNNNEIQNRLFPKNNWKDFVNKYTEVYSPLDGKWATNKKEYIAKLKGTNGNYDVWTGKVQGYGFSVDTDGTYNVSLEISAGNELASQLLSQSSKAEGKKSAKVIKDDYKSYIAKIADDIDTSLLKTFEKPDEWKNEFFNWGIESKKAEDNIISKTPYISFRLILNIINALHISPNIIWGTVGKDGVIPVSATKFMMSSNENVIFPGTLPDIIVNGEGKIQVGHKAEKDPKTKKNTFKVSPGKESKINGYSFLLDETGAVIKNFKLPTDTTEISLPAYTGNLLNVFIKYDTFLSYRNNTVKNSDLLFELLTLIQMSMYGYSYLELATPDSVPNSNRGLTIIDRKLPRVFTPKKESTVHRFKIGPTNSIVHTFSFDFQMDDLMAGQTLYASQIEISEAKEGVTTQQAENLRFKETLAANADMKSFKNADNFHSINPIEVKIQKELREKKLADDAKSKKDAHEETKKELDAAAIKKQKEKTEKEKQAKDSLDKNFVRFKLKATDKDTHNLIYTDEALLKYYLVKNPEPDTVLVSGVTVTIVIDGISGFATGDYFFIDGVPEIYNQNGCFQIMSIQQGINNEGWLTTITADWLRKQI